MLYNDAETIQGRLDDRFPDNETTLTRLRRPTSSTEDDGDKHYRVSTELVSPLGADELASLVGMAQGVEGVELTLELAGGVGTTFTAVYQ